MRWGMREPDMTPVTICTRLNRKTREARKAEGRTEKRGEREGCPARGEAPRVRTGRGGDSCSMSEGAGARAGAVNRRSGADSKANNA